MNLKDPVSPSNKPYKSVNDTPFNARETLDLRGTLTATKTSFDTRTSLTELLQQDAAQEHEPWSYKDADSQDSDMNVLDDVGVSTEASATQIWSQSAADTMEDMKISTPGDSSIHSHTPPNDDQEDSTILLTEKDLAEESTDESNKWVIDEKPASSADDSGVTLNILDAEAQAAKQTRLTVNDKTIQTQRNVLHDDLAEMLTDHIEHAKRTKQIISCTLVAHSVAELINVRTALHATPEWARFLKIRVRSGSTDVQQLVKDGYLKNTHKNGVYADISPAYASNAYLASTILKIDDEDAVRQWNTSGLPMPLFQKKICTKEMELLQKAWQVQTTEQRPALKRSYICEKMRYDLAISQQEYLDTTTTNSQKATELANSIRRSYNVLKTYEGLLTARTQLENGQKVTLRIRNKNAFIAVNKNEMEDLEKEYGGIADLLRIHETQPVAAATTPVVAATPAPVVPRAIPVAIAVGIPVAKKVEPQNQEAAAMLAAISAVDNHNNYSVPPKDSGSRYAAHQALQRNIKSAEQARNEKTSPEGMFGAIRSGWKKIFG